MPFDATSLKSRAKQIPAAFGSMLGKARARYEGWSKRQRLIALGAGGLALALLVLLVSFSLNQPRAELVTAMAQRQDIERTVVATGVLEPTRLVSVGAQVSGQVRRLHVILGQTVRQGDLIAEIDSTQQTNSVATAQASLAMVRAQRASAAASLQQAQSTFNRQAELLAVDAVSRADYETAQASLASARSSVAALDAQIREANISLDNARVNLGYTRIVAPMDGTIVAIVTEEGQTVNANQTAPTIVKLAQLDTMTVSAEISEADVFHVTEGQRVYFTTLGDTSQRHYATVRAVAPAPASIEQSDDLSAGDAAVYYNAVFEVENADGRLRTGMTATVYVVLESAENALAIPSAALGVRAPDGTYEVRVQAESGALETRRVKVGVNTNSMAQVLEGLQEGERVVLAEAARGDAGAQSASRPAGGAMMMGGPPAGGRRP